MSEIFESSENKIEVIERIPTSEEVLEAIKHFIGESEYSERRTYSDEKGLCLLEINVPTKDGGHVEYSYIRKGSHEVGGSSPDTVIHILFFDADNKNVPIGGHDVAKFIDGKWKFIKK